MRFRVIHLLVFLSIACSKDTVAGPDPQPTDPVASVTISGATRVKVGDQYQLFAEARLASGEVVERAVTWQVVAPTMADVDSDGELIAHQEGEFTVRAVVEGITASHQVTSYDWSLEEQPAVKLLRLASDNSLDAGRPDLVVLCGGGTVFVLVTSADFEIEDGTISYRFDDGDPVEEQWLPVPETRVFLYPGTTNASHKALAGAIAGSGRFSFGFKDAGGEAYQAEFRVTGLSDRLPGVLAGCPSEL